jgi:DUF971 family protein
MSKSLLGTGWKMFEYSEQRVSDLHFDNGNSQLIISRYIETLCPCLQVVAQSRQRNLVENQKIFF